MILQIGFGCLRLFKCFPFSLKFVLQRESGSCAPYSVRFKMLTFGRESVACDRLVSRRVPPHFGLRNLELSRMDLIEFGSLPKSIPDASIGA